MKKNTVCKLFRNTIISLTWVILLIVPLTSFGNDSKVKLSPEELSWINKKNTVRVRIGSAPPFMLTDGKIRGIAIDYLTTVFNRNGIKFNYVQESEVTWPQALKYIEQHDVVDMVPTAKITDERKKHMLFTNEYIVAPWVIFTRSDADFVGSIDDLKGKTVSVEEGFVIHDLLKRNYPEINLKVISAKLDNNFAEIPIKDLSTGLVDAYIGNLLMTTYMIQSKGYTNVKVAAPTPFENHNQAMAIRDDWPELVSIINKTIASMTPEEHSAIRNRWLGIRYEYGISKTDVLKWILSIAGIAALFVLFVLIWNRRLKKEMNERELTKNALQESEENFKTMFENAPLSYQSLDENGNFTEVNQTWLKIMGYERGEVLGKNFSEFLTPEQKDHFTENFQRFKALGEVLGAEFEMVKKDGSCILVSFHGKIGKDNHGDFKKTHCIFQDITTRKMLQNESEKNKTILIEAEALAGFGGWEWDIKKDSWTMSQNWLNIHGCSSSTISTVELIKIAHSEDVPKIQKAFNRIVNDGGIYDIEHRIFHQKTGEIKDIHSYGEARLDDTGRIVKVFGVAQDITEQKKAEKSSVRLKERLESLWNISKIADSDIKTISDHVLAEVQKMTQSRYAFYGFLDKNENDMIIHAWSHETMDDCKTNEKTLHFAIDKAGIWAEAVKEKKILTINDFNLDHPGKRGMPDGHVRLTRLMTVPYIKNDKVISIVAVANKDAEYSDEDEKQVLAFMRNVQMLIDRKKSEQEKIELSSQLQQAQKMESIGTLAGGIAHDFNNILFPIVGHTEMLIEDVPEDSPFRESLSQIYTGAMRASELVKQILTFSRQESGELKLMKIQPIVKEALKLIRSTIPTTIEIKQNIQANCGAIKADPTQIHQIVINLCTNAYHAMEETGGELKVGLKEIKLGVIDLINPDMTPGQYACLTIADAGTGMDKELTHKIFDPFFTTKEKGKGTGMGLSVVHGIVAGMGGAVRVYSEPGKGTQFYVYLPVEKSSFKKHSVQTHVTIQGGIECILLVDDEEAILSMERQMLERLGYQVTSCTSSIEALEAFRDSPDKFDLVITDMAMPNMPGDKLSAELIKIRPDIPVLLCTGFSETMSKEKTESLGIKDFLLKPIVMKDLAQKIREVLED